MGKHPQPGESSGSTTYRLLQRGIRLPGCSCTSCRHQRLNLQKSGSFPHNSPPRCFILTALGTLPPNEASGCLLHLARYYCISCIYSAVAQIQSYWWGSAAHVNNTCAWFSSVSPALPGCRSCCPAARGTAERRLPRAGHEHGCPLPVHQQEDDVLHVNG